jgi:hypothetical protein
MPQVLEHNPSMDLGGTPPEGAAPNSKNLDM